MLRIAVAQINPTVGDLEGNYKKILQQLEIVEEKQADLVVFPELSICGYPPEDLLFKEHFVRDNIDVLHSIARKVCNVCAIIGFVDRDSSKNLYNAAAIIYDHKVRGVYYKKNLPNYGVFDEKRYFTEGKKDLLFYLEDVLFGVNICEDIWIDKGAYYSQAKRGAEVLINISSSPYVEGKVNKREQLFKKRARETNSYIIYVNTIGGQDELVFDGNSRIIDSKGKIISKGKSFEEDLFFVDIDLKKKKVKRKKRILYFRQNIKKKSEEIGPHKVYCPVRIESIYKALVLGTRDYIKKNDFEKVVIGLSGGIDSSVVAAIAVAAIGKENVIGVTMPSQYTSQETKKDAKTLADNLGISLIELSIREIYFAYEKVLQGEFSKVKKGVAEENLQARIRGNLLMALSNKFGWLVLTTGNKSELAVGYCTLYGDMSGGFAVIKDIPKTKIYELAEFINEKENNIIPNSIIKRSPTAELRPNQKDQDMLPPYNILDSMLASYVEKHQSIVKRGNRKKRILAKKIVFLVDKNEYKRRQSPPGIKITERSFGKDWRLPITNRYREKSE